MTKNIVLSLLSLAFFFAGATVATAKTPPADIPVVFPDASPQAIRDVVDECTAKISHVRDLQRALPTNRCPSGEEMAAIARATADAQSECATLPRRIRANLLASMRANRRRWCDGEMTDDDFAASVLQPQPRRRRSTGRREAPATPATPAAPQRLVRPTVVCHQELGAVPTADGESCECVQERYIDGRPVVGVLVHTPQRYSEAQHFGCPDRSVAAINYALVRLREMAAAQDARDRAQDARMDGFDRRFRDQRQRDADQDRDTGNAREIAERALRERPTSIEERFHIDLLGRARLVIPGQVGGGAPVAGGSGLGLRFRWRCNVCSSRDEFYFAVAGGAGFTGAGVGMTAFGEMGIGYTRYLDSRRVIGLSVGALAYGFGLMGQEATPTEPGLHGDLRRWGVGGEILFDFSLTGGSRSARPNRTEVRLQVGLALTYDTAFWWSDQDGLMESTGFGATGMFGGAVNF